MSQDKSKSQGETISGRATKWMFTFADELDGAERIGADNDNPEGARWIQISDELASAVAENLRMIANRWGR